MSSILAVSSGDPSGIGPDIALAAWALRASARLPAFFLLGDEKLIAARAARLGMDCPIEITTPEDADRVFGQALPVVP
ncbi:MAG: 4-hydroxythreonine-4-phosphate dehydrogenase, partial [Phyllobacterium sp.]|nr:4-hydroxythreonine-4-phosphate dehydrogenase [Phyllobacterium sp.]